MSVLRFLYDFIVGDDAALFLIVAAGIAATALLTINAWWLLPVVVCAALAWSIHRAAR
jgi:hypothetical protein